jgi:hypothetical protein
MSFSDNLGNFASNQLNKIGNEIGWTVLGHDIASVASNDKSWVGDAFQIAGDVFKGSLAGITYAPRKVLGAAFNDVILPVARTSYNVGGKYAREPLSAGLLGLATNDWQQSWAQRGEISAGQATAYLQSRFDPTQSGLRGDFNIFDANDRKVFDTNWEYRTLSGAYDTFFTTVTDPLGKVGKAAQLARKALVLQPLGATDAGITQLTKDFLIPKSTRNVTILSPQTLATKINEGRDATGGLYNSMEWFAKNDKLAIRNHPMVAASNDADTLAYLLGEAKTTDDVADVLLATATKDTEAMARLVAKRKDMAFVMDKLKPVSELDKQIMNNMPTNAIVEDLNILDAAATHVAYAMNDPYIKYLTSLNTKGLDLAKRTFGNAMAQRGAIRSAERQTSRALGETPSPTSYPTLGIFQPTKYHPVVAVVNFAERWAGERPAGYFNANDSDSFNEIKAMGGMLRRIVGDEAAAPIIARHYDDFITAGDIPEARARVAASFEELGIAQVNKSLGISDETAKYIWDAYKGRRKTAMDSIRDRKFLMTNDGTILKIPYLERQGANALPIVDLENYARVLKENSGLIKAIDGSHGIVDPDEFKYIAGIMNDMWKASVLLRLGYTVRNVGEASMSIMAKGYGLVAASELSTEGVKKWYNNRIIGVERLTDKKLVSKGLREDSVKLRQQLASVQQDRAQIASLNKDIDEHMAAVELAFKRGQLTEEQMMEFLDVSSYRTGEFLYHGSPTGLTGLNPKRPLAMSYSAEVAEKYADAGMRTISATEIQKRLTGTAGRLPKNIEQAPGGQIGTPEVFAQMPESDFRQVQKYVRGNFSTQQNQLRNQLEVTSDLNPYDLKLPEVLQRAIKRSVVKKPTIVYRGSTTNAEFGEIPLNVGDIVTDKGFVSTSKSGTTAIKFSNFKGGEPVIYKIALPKGHPGLDIKQTYNDFNESIVYRSERKGFTPFNSYGQTLRSSESEHALREQEVLLPAGTKYKVAKSEFIPFMGYGSGDEPIRVITLQAIPLKASFRQASGGLQTIAADMREGFINSIAKGNQVELLNPQTGTWRAIDPASISQRLLVEGKFRIRKPGNQGQILHSKVFGTPVDLRSNNGTGSKLGLNDYPELKKLGLDARKPDSWKGKEKELFDWMRANGVGKLTLPDVKANGRATVLVDPTMVETATNKPTQMLAKRQLDAIRNTRAVTSNQSKILQMIQSTVENSGGTFKFMTGDVPQGGFPVAVRGGTFQYSLDAAKANPEAMAQQLAEHIENTIGKFSEADHFGTWVAPAEDGTMHIWAEPVNVVKNRAEAVKLGKERNQQKIYDLNIFEEINIGGTGDVGASENFALGQGTKAVRSNVTRGTQGVRPELSKANRTANLSELATHIGSGKYPTDGIVNLVRDLADRDALVRANHENLLARLDARVVEESRLNAPKQMLGTGMRRTTLYDGTVIEHGDAFQGEPGQILAQQTDNADTYKLMADAPSQLFAARYGNMQETRLSASDPRYFNGYANFLNNFFRSPTENKIDPVIELFLNNKTPEFVVNWLRKDPKGIAYAEKMNIDDKAFKVASQRLNVGTDAEDFVGNLHSGYQRYLPDAEIQEAFRANQLDEMWLRKHFADQPAMPDIIGSTIPVGPRVNFKSAAGYQKFVEKAFYFLGSLPETTLARHPLARAVYRTEMQQRGNIALSLKRSQLNDPKAELTLDEINGLRRDAVESTRKEVNKTLFTIIRKSYAGEKMRYIMPFFSAWENTIRRWATLSKDNPVALAKAGQITATLSNQNNVVDKNGNLATTFSYDNVIVLPMPETFMKTMEKIPGASGLAAAIRSTGGQVSIPIRSLDVMFQGEATAGFGPIVALPAGELEKMRPDFETILAPVLPFGAQEGNLIEAGVKSILPPYLQKAAQTWSTTRDGQWSRTFNTVYRYELIKYKLGERTTEPTFEDIQRLTNDMYRVKMLSNLILPFAAQYDSPLSWYTQQYRKLQQTYGMKADALFLQMYPEMAEATISASMNNTGVSASQKAVSNIQKYKGLLSKIGTTTPEMIGFVVNDPSGKYDFSNAAYQWQMRNTPVPGSTTNFRGQRDPALLKQDANKKSGWIDYRKGMDYLDSQLYGQGFQSYSESGAEELNLMKQMYTQQLAQANKDWAADFYSVDKGKWIYRMQTIKTILSDPEWVKDNASRPVVNQIAIYYNTRTQIARELASRKAGGGAASLEAKDNEDLNRLWTNTVATLRQESGGEFDAFYQRFLQNDPVTLG